MNITPDLLTTFITQVPGTAAVVFVVIIFIRYLGRQDRILWRMESRSAKVIESNTRILHRVSTMLDQGGREPP
jgi:hypothetical protein